MKLAVPALVLLASGCGLYGEEDDALVGAPEPGAPVVSGEPRVAAHDCDVGAGYELDTHVAPGDGRLHIIGVYESRNDDPSWWAEPTCRAYLDSCGTPEGCDPEQLDVVCDRTSKVHDATIHVAIGGPSSLVLTAYEPTHWKVTVAPGAQLDHLIVSGHHEQTAEVAGAQVTPEVARIGHGFEWFTPEELALTCEEVETSPGYCDGPTADDWRMAREQRAAELAQLVAHAEARTKTKLRSFSGCYSMSTATLESVE